MGFPSFDLLIDAALSRGSRRIAVARAEDPVVLDSLAAACSLGLVEPVLFGERDRIRRLMDDAGIDRPWRIEHVAGDDAACARAGVDAVRRGEAELLMKGQLPTATLFKAALDHHAGLPRSGLLSHIVFIETSCYHKLFAMTDGGLNRAPDLATKAAIARNAIDAFHRLGLARPKVALLSYVEKASKGCRETTEWVALREAAARGELGEAVVEGPMALDLCLSAEAARIKGFPGEVCGDADIVVVPDITVCNATAKAFFLTGAIAAGAVIGSATPIVALSRGDSSRTRLCSISLSSLLYEPAGDPIEAKGGAPG